nr:hypothetical protein [uncultured Bacteroidetes bacterium 'SBI2-18 P41A3']
MTKYIVKEKGTEVISEIHQKDFKREIPNVENSSQNEVKTEDPKTEDSKENFTDVDFDDI